MHPNGRRRIRFQSFRRPNRPLYQIATAIRAVTSEPSIRAARAKRAFVRANSRIPRVRRKITIAAFTVGSEFEHSNIVPGGWFTRIAASTERRPAHWCPNDPAVAHDLCNTPYLP